MSIARGYSMRFSFKMGGRVRYVDAIGTIAFLRTLLGLFLYCWTAPAALPRVDKRRTYASPSSILQPSLPLTPPHNPSTGSGRAQVHRPYPKRKEAHHVCSKRPSHPPGIAASALDPPAVALAIYGLGRDLSSNVCGKVPGALVSLPHAPGSRSHMPADGRHPARPRPCRGDRVC